MQPVKPTGSQCEFAPGGCRWPELASVLTRPCLPARSPNALDHTPYWQNRGNIKLHFMISIMILCEWLCGFDGTIIGSLQALPAWQADLGYPTGARLGLLNAMSSITGCLISPFNAYICDRFGRRWPIRCKPVLLFRVD